MNPIEPHQFSLGGTCLAAFYGNQARFTDAEPLYDRSLAIREKVLGPNHPDVAQSLNNLAALLDSQARYANALPIVQRLISQNGARKSVAFAVLYHSLLQNIIPPRDALDASYNVLQRSVSSAAGEAVSELAARFAVGNSELAQLVRNDQDLTAEADRLDKSIIAAVSKPPAERNVVTEDQMRKRIEEVKSERDKLQDVFNQRFPDYVALSKPQPLTIEQTQALLADDEALVTIDLDKKSYVWVITKDRAEWKELAINAEDVSKLFGLCAPGSIHGLQNQNPSTAVRHISSIGRCWDGLKSLFPKRRGCRLWSMVHSAVCLYRCLLRATLKARI